MFGLLPTFYSMEEGTDGSLGLLASLSCCRGGFAKFWDCILHEGCRLVVHRQQAIMDEAIWLLSHLIRSANFRNPGCKTSSSDFKKKTSSSYYMCNHNLMYTLTSEIAMHTLCAFLKYYQYARPFPAPAETNFFWESLALHTLLSLPPQFSSTSPPFFLYHIQCPCFHSTTQFNLPKISSINPCHLEALQFNSVF